MCGGTDTDIDADTDTDKQMGPSAMAMADAHCHLHTSCTLEQAMALGGSFLLSASTPAAVGGGGQKSEFGCTPNEYAVMSTNHVDIDIVDTMSRQSSLAVYPFFGVHPWYSHLFYAGKPPQSKAEHYAAVLYPPPAPELLARLPSPLSLASHLAKITAIVDNRTSNARGVGIGEIGLDKPFRIPTNGYYGNSAGSNGPNGPSEKISLTGCRVKVPHQVELLRAQLELAHTHKLPVSLHCVKSHGSLFDECKQFQGLKVILHSYSGSTDQAKAWVKLRVQRQLQVYFSLSNVINATESKADAFSALLDVLPDECILLETDISIDESIPDGTHQRHYEQIFQKVCSHRTWTAEQGKRVLMSNWRQLKQQP